MISLRKLAFLRGWEGAPAYGIDFEGFSDPSVPRTAIPRQFRLEIVQSRNRAQA